MKRYLAVSGLLVALSMCLVPVAAAAEDGWLIAVRGGGLSDPGLEAGPAFATGFNLGGSIGRRLGERVVLRANFSFARAQGRGAGIGGSDFERFVYDGDVLFRLRRGVGAVPYLFGGAGVVTLSQRIPVRDETFRSNFTKAHGKLGAGLGYETAGGFGAFVEGTGMLYGWDRFGFRDERQLDVTWSAGVSYGFGK